MIRRSTGRSYLKKCNLLIMGVKNLEKYLFVLVLIFLTNRAFGQGSVPIGINYQAVARDNSGKELVSKSRCKIFYSFRKSSGDSCLSGAAL